MAGPLGTNVVAADREPAARTLGVGRIVVASLIGTTIEFYDFYIYGTAAALVIGQTFFPKSAPEAQPLNAFLTFGIAFLARPIGSVVFGHYGDRIGRKATLVGSMLVMGLATTLIGLLPGYAQAGVLAPWLLCALRFFQGIGLGGVPGTKRNSRRSSTSTRRAFTRNPFCLWSRTSAWPSEAQSKGPPRHRSGPSIVVTAVGSGR